MIHAIEKNLEKGMCLLEAISNEDYSSKTIPPYYSSIGSHIRHILDFFSCIFKGLENNNNVDFTSRDRASAVEQNTEVGIAYFNQILQQLHTLNNQDLEKTIMVTDDMGLGKVTVKYTLAALLMYAQSHTIHHYATIGYIIYQLGIDLPDSNFGFNPTTPKKVAIS